MLHRAAAGLSSLLSSGLGGLALRLSMGGLGEGDREGEKEGEREIGREIGRERGRRERDRGRGRKIIGK